jgi:hypothetical protein
MFSFDVENITKGIGVVTATLAMVGGGYTFLDRFEDKSILTWAPEHFEVSDGPRDGTFDVVVAREKHRDDCRLKVLDSKSKTASIWFIQHHQASLSSLDQRVIRLISSDTRLP